MHVLDKLITEADTTELSYGRTRVLDYLNVVFEIKVGGVFKNAVQFNIGKNTVTYKKNEYSLTDTTPEIFENKNYEIWLNVGGEDIVLYEISKKYPAEARKICYYLTTALQIKQESECDEVENINIKHPILWISTKLANSKIIYDFDTNILSLDEGTFKKKYVDFDLKNQRFKYNKKSYSFNSILDILMIDDMTIRIALKDQTVIDIHKEVINRNISSIEKEAYIIKYMQCLKQILIYKKYKLPTKNDRYVYIDETLEDYQKWINSVEILESDVEMINSLFFEVNDMATKMIFNREIKKYKAKKNPTAVNLEQYKLFDILVYAKNMKIKLLRNDISVEEYWGMKKEIFNILQKRYNSFEELSNTYLKERANFFKSNEEFIYTFVEKRKDLELYLHRVHKLKECLATELLQNKLSVWNNIDYNLKLEYK